MSGRSDSVREVVDAVVSVVDVASQFVSAADSLLGSSGRRRRRHAGRDRAAAKRRRGVKHHKKTLYQNQEGRCAACGTEQRIELLDVDHIKPVSKGGSDRIDNLQLLGGSHGCRCNSIKGDRSQEYLLRKISEGRGRNIRSRVAAEHAAIQAHKAQKAGAAGRTVGTARGNARRSGRKRCGAWMPRAKTHCALAEGHAGPHRRA